MPTLGARVSAGGVFGPEPSTPEGPSPDKLRAGVGFCTRGEGKQERVRHQVEVTE